MKPTWWSRSIAVSLGILTGVGLALLMHSWGWFG